MLWDVETGNAICGTPTCTDFTIAVKFLNNDGAKLVTCGNYNLHVWHYDHLTNKLVPSDVQLGQLRRCFTCLTVDAADQYMYCGSATGDVLQVRLHAIHSTPHPARSKQFMPSPALHQAPVDCMLNHLTAPANSTSCTGNHLTVIKHPLYMTPLH